MGTANVSCLLRTALRDGKVWWRAILEIWQRAVDAVFVTNFFLFVFTMSVSATVVLLGKGDMER